MSMCIEIGLTCMPPDISIKGVSSVFLIIKMSIKRSLQSSDLPQFIFTLQIKL